MSRTKLCCVCETWKSGGIESFLYNIFLHMDLSQFEIDVVAECYYDSVFTEALERRGIRFIQLSGKLRSPKNSIMFRSLLRHRRYDVAHFNFFHGLSLYYVQLAKEEGVPTRIVHSHGAGLRNSATKPLKLLFHYVGRRLWTAAASDFWACSQSAAAFLFSRPRGGVRIIPNGIDLDRFSFLPEERSRMREQLGVGQAFVVGTVGRLSQEKNQTFLLDVFAELIRLHANSRLLIVGEGDQGRRLREKAARLGVSAQVIFYGTSDQVERLLWAMDAFAFPSLFEGFGLAAIEAQAAGLPVVCSRGVPAEARIAPNIRAMALSDGARSWAEALLAMASAQARDEALLAVRKAGYDIADVAQLVQMAYLQVHNG